MASNAYYRAHFDANYIVRELSWMFASPLMILLTVRRKSITLKWKRLLIAIP